MPCMSQETAVKSAMEPSVATCVKGDSKGDKPAGF